MYRCRVRVKYGLVSGCASTIACARGTQPFVSLTNFGNAASRAGDPWSPEPTHSFACVLLAVISGAIAWHNALSAALVFEVAVGEVDG
jgi:hypothetical protein